MTRSVLLATASVAALALSSPAEARPHGGIAVAGGGGITCLYGTGTGDNGCSGANQNGSFQSAGLLTVGQQSGQISLFPLHSNPANNIVPFNIPGIDYPIAYDKTLTLKDPRTISDGVCAWNVPGNYVACTGSGTVNEVINGYDFCGTTIGKSAVLLYVGGGGVNIGSTFTATNNNFCDLGSGTPFGITGNYSYIIKYNQFDGTGATLSSDSPVRDDGQAFGTNVDFEYNAFTNINTVRAFGGGSNSGATQTWKYNYARGLNDLNTTSHGEMSLLSCGSGTNPNCANKTLDHFTAIGNFVISNSLTDAYCSGGGGAGGCINSATWFLSNGAPHGVYVTTTTFTNNVAITNTSGAPGGGPATPTTSHMWGVGLMSGIFPTDSLTYTGNWADGTGSTACSTNGPSNSDQGTASTSGNTITITALSSGYNGSPIDKGWLLRNVAAGFTDAKITAYGTGTGKLGTYTFDGPPQTIGSTSGWTILPYIGSLTASNNKSIADPTNTGVAASIDPSLPALAANCPGSHN